MITIRCECAKRYEQRQGALCGLFRSGPCGFAKRADKRFGNLFSPASEGPGLLCCAAAHPHTMQMARCVRVGHSYCHSVPWYRRLSPLNCVDAQVLSPSIHTGKRTYTRADGKATKLAFGKTREDSSVRVLLQSWIWHVGLPVVYMAVSGRQGVLEAPAGPFKYRAACCGVRRYLQCVEDTCVHLLLNVSRSSFLCEQKKPRSF